MLDLSVSAIPDTATKRGELSACPSCSAPAPPAFIQLTELPVHGTAVFATAAEARAVTTGDQELALCGTCGVVFNRAFDMSKLDYTGEHEESQHLSPRFAAYAAELSKQWVDRHRLRDAHVVEIGCGAGDFAAELLRAGVGNVTGIDPHFGPERVPADLAQRLCAVPAFYSPEMVESGTAAVVCRHTLEHIPELAVFGADILRGMRAAGVPVLLAEVPDLGRILTDGAFWDLQYEHCSYFTPATLAGYLGRLGFDVLGVQTTYTDQYVVAEASPADRRDTADDSGLAAELDRLHQLCEGFATHTLGRIAHWGSWLDDRLAAGETVVVWGGGAKGLTFLNMLREHAGAVSAVVDINPGLQHHYIGGLGLPIVAPRDLVSAPPRTVLLMNPVYADEVRALLDELGLQATELITV
jgi:2-polyprenyl-3-methyl-5-hydroxy-6-metoxy-1,4-benzoquinol methylase